MQENLKFKILSMIHKGIKDIYKIIEKDKKRWLNYLLSTLLAIFFLQNFAWINCEKQNENEWGGCLSDTYPDFLLLHKRSL